ncbi:hypothetical protein N0V85_004694 [Neurospora sp. IMI 360204]|nr:hypothetical protein N0V85_004694 [Neurospora sp. IMI 360204]
MSFPQPPHAGANSPTPFSLMTFMMSNALSDHEKTECWKTIDIIYSNLLNHNGGLRSFAEIVHAIQQQLHNPSLRDGTLLTGVNFPREVYRWFADHHDSGLLDQAVARLGQSKPFLRGLERYLTVAERENRRTESTDPKEHIPLPHNLLKSWSDALALSHWARVQTRRPVNPAPKDIPKDFEEKTRLAKYIFDGMVAEPQDMVERPEDDEEEDGKENAEGNEKAKGKEGKKEKIHAQVKRVREMSDLKKYILSWDWLLVSRSKASLVNSTGTSYLSRFAAHPRHELAVKVTNKGTNATRNRQVKAGQQEHPGEVRPDAASDQASERPKKRRRREKGPLERVAEEHERQAAAAGRAPAVSEPEFAGQINASESDNGNVVSANTNIGSSNTPMNVDRSSSGQNHQGTGVATWQMSTADTYDYPYSTPAGANLPIGSTPYTSLAAPGNRAWTPRPHHRSFAAYASTPTAGPVNNTPNNALALTSAAAPVNNSFNNAPALIGNWDHGFDGYEQGPHEQSYFDLDPHALSAATAVNSRLQTQSSFEDHEPQTQTVSAAQPRATWAHGDGTQAFGAPYSGSSSPTPLSQNAETADTPTAPAGQAANSRDAGPGNGQVKWDGWVIDMED